MKPDIFECEQAALDFLEQHLWQYGAVCTYCKSKHVGKLVGKSTRNGLYKCYTCRKQFTIKTETLFEGSRIPINKWLRALYLYNLRGHSVTAQHFQMELGVTCKTAYYIIQRIADAFRAEDDALRILPSLMAVAPEVIRPTRDNLLSSSQFEIVPSQF